MAFVGILNNTEFYSEQGFTDLSPEIDFSQDYDDGTILKRGENLFKVNNNLSFVNSELSVTVDSAEQYEYAKDNLYQIENDTYLAMYQYPEYHDNPVQQCDESLYHGKFCDLYGDLTKYEVDGEHHIFTFKIDCCDDNGYWQYTVVSQKVNAYTFNVVLLQRQKYNCDDSEDGYLWTLANSGKIYILDTNNPTLDYSKVDADDWIINYRVSSVARLYRITRNLLGTESYPFKKLPAFIYTGKRNELKPFDGYYSVAKSTDESINKIYEVKALSDANSLILGGIIAKSVNIKLLRDGMVVQESSFYPDTLMDGYGLLGSSNVTTITKLDIKQDDLIYIEFGDGDVEVGSIETSTVVDDGLTKYSFSFNFVNYNNKTEEFGEVELGTKPLVGRVSITNVVDFSSGRQVYNRYKKLQLHNIIYDPFDSYINPTMSSWVLRGFIEDVKVNTKQVNEDSYPELFSVAVNIREIL